MQKSGVSWYVVIILTFLLWGTQHPPIKILSGEISPVLFNFLRYFFAGLALVPFVLNERVKIKKEDLLGLSFLGFMGIFISVWV